MKDLLKFLTCGSVDDGKSTLIGHMLYDSKQLYADQEQALQLDSRVGSANGQIDYSLLLDGLMSEREQGITIDVAYRYFKTEARSYIVADAPGHEEYTRNMAVAASFAQLAVILIDASKGVQIQTRRHARICYLMGIRDMVFAINKMDMVGYDRQRFKEIESTIHEMTEPFPLNSLTIIPVSATAGDNITEHSDRMPWYTAFPSWNIWTRLKSLPPRTARNSPCRCRGCAVPTLPSAASRARSKAAASEWATRSAAFPAEKPPR